MTASPEIGVGAQHRHDGSALAWAWPIDLERYDRTGPLSSAERDGPHHG